MRSQQQYEAAVGALTSSVNEHVCALQSTIEKWHSTLTTLKADLELATAFYEKVGVAFPSEVLARNFDAVYNEGTIWGYFRDIANSLKRPYIRAEIKQKLVYDNRTREHYVTSYVELTAPFSTKMGNLFAGLMILSTQLPVSPDMRGPVCHDHGKGTYKFIFTGPDGRAMFDGWLEQCRTDPVFKLCLGV